MFRRKAQKIRKGFTLLELMVVIAIIIFLTALTVPLFSNLLGSSGLTSTQRMIQSAMYKARTMSSSLRKKTALVFERDWTDAANNYPFTGKITMYNLEAEYDDDGSPTTPPKNRIEKISGEDMALPTGTYLENCPYIIVFHNNALTMYQSLAAAQPEGHIEYWTNPIAGVYPEDWDSTKIGVYADIKTSDFQSNVVERLKDGLDPMNLTLGVPSWDIKFRVRQDAAQACYMNVVALQGRVGKFVTGSASVVDP